MMWVAGSLCPCTQVEYRRWPAFVAGSHATPCYRNRLEQWCSAGFRLVLHVRRAAADKGLWVAGTPLRVGSGWRRRGCEARNRVEYTRWLAFAAGSHATPCYRNRLEQWCSAGCRLDQLGRVEPGPLW